MRLEEFKGKSLLLKPWLKPISDENYYLTYYLKWVT